MFHGRDNSFAAFSMGRLYLSQSGCVTGWVRTSQQQNSEGISGDRTAQKPPRVFAYSTVVLTERTPCPPCFLFVLERSFRVEPIMMLMVVCGVGSLFLPLPLSHSGG